jgi:ATP-dependent Clp protease ATP-binding subunit ClpA
MFGRFVTDARRVVVRAADHEAQSLGSATVEAEHLLLALAAERDTPAGRLLADTGLDPDGLRAALERETERSLAAVGVTLSDFELPEQPSAMRDSARFATSAKRALERSLQVAVARKDRRITAPHLLVGILRADLGTVPRALEAAGVDRVALATRAEQLLGGPAG